MSDVRAVQPIAPPGDARIVVPGSRSITNRALVCAALAPGDSRISGWLDAEDTQAMREGLTALGARISVDHDSLVVTGTGGRVVPPTKPIDCRQSGTTMRFLTAIAALADGWVSLTGTPRLRQRPIGPLLDSLAALDVRVSDDPAAVTVCGPLSGGSATLDASASGQFLSALLLAGACTKTGLRIEVGPVASEPFVEMTRRVMESFGARPAKMWSKRQTPGSAATYVVRPKGYQPAEVSVEPDVMSASYFFAAAAVTGGSVLVSGIERASMQGDIAVLDALEAMGCTVEETGEGVRVTGASLSGTTFDVSALPDMAPTLAVVACFASSPTTLTGVRHLRIKESDRLAALEAELTKLGARVLVDEDLLTVHPPARVSGARIATYDDHRMAMAFAVAGLAVEGILIEDPGCVGKTFPGFFETLETLG